MPNRLVQAVGLLGAVAALSACGARDAGPTYHWDFSVVVTYFPVLLDGARFTLLLTAASMFPGMALGVLVAAGRLSRFGPVNMAFTGYIEFMRNTPVLVQIIWIYYSLPVLVAVNIPDIPAAVIALSVSVSAFYGEAFRAGITAVPRQLTETAEVLGLGYLQRMRYVALPIAFKTVLPVLVSTTITLLKETSLVSIIGSPDLMYNGKNIAIQTYRPMEILSAVAVLYFVILFPLSMVSRMVERYLQRSSAITGSAVDGEIGSSADDSARVAVV